MTFRRFIYFPAALLCLLAGGCAIVGLVGNALPRPTVPAQYTGLTGQPLGVMVYADRGVLYDFPSLRQDVATVVQNNLLQAVRGKEKLLEGTTFPYAPAKFVRYQENFPEIQVSPPTAYAGNFRGITRLIYIEIESFSTRSDEAPELYRGSANATLKVLEIAPDGTASIAYEEPDLRIVYPTYAPVEGLPSGSDRVIYAGTVDGLGGEIALRFIPHPEADRK